MAYRKDFFISYNKADRQWAEWIAWVLEAEQYTTVVQEWDFKPGGNFVVEMDNATKQCERTIAVLSQAYLNAEFTVPEWAAKFAQDPKGLGRKLVPVRVAPCNVEGLLGQVIYCDLVGLDEEAARKRLLSQLSPGRTKPAVAPSFPGSTTEPAFPAAQQPRVTAPRPLWTPLGQPVHAQWRADSTRSEYSRSTLELHSIPVDQRSVEARVLRDLPDALSILGRQGGLFDQNEAVQSRSILARQREPTWCQRNCRVSRPARGDLAATAIRQPRIGLRRGGCQESSNCIAGAARQHWASRRRRSGARSFG